MTPSVQHRVSDKPVPSTHRLRHIPELDGVRGIAAVMVFFHHVCFTSISPAGWDRPIQFLRTLSSAGATGVDLFFVLSGFLITSILIDSRKSSAYYHDFYWKRALRILPLLLLCLLGVYLFIPGSKTYVILSALFVSNFASVLHVQTTGPFWTLAIEEQFYLLWPTVVRRRSVSQLKRWAVGVGLSAILLRFVAAAFGHYNYDLTFLRCDGLACGALLACWFSQRNSYASTPPAANRLIAFALCAGILLLPVTLLSTDNLRTYGCLGALNQTGVTFVCGSIIAFLISHSGHRGLSWLRSPLFTFFGLISYAMYLIHIYVLMAYDHFRGKLQQGDDLAYMIRFFTILGVTIILCVLIRHLIELPAMSLRKYVLSKDRA
jgi:peptidoglycan/LPS O-acetylase OafA/YrhL